MHRESTPIGFERRLLSPVPVFSNKMPIQSARRARWLLGCVALGVLTIGQLTAAAQPPPAPPTPSTTAPTPSPAIANIIGDAQAKVKAGQFAEAVAALTAVRSSGGSAADRDALDIALSDTEFSWGVQLSSSPHSQDALPQFRASAQIDSSKPMRRGHFAENLRREGLTYLNARQFKEAMDLFNTALPIFRSLNDQLHLAHDLGNLGTGSFYLNQFDTSIDYFEQALSIYRALDDQADVAIILLNEGGAYQSRNQYEKAIANYEQASVLFRDSKKRIGEAVCLANLATLYCAKNEYEEAIKVCQLALPIFREVKNQNGEAQILRSLGIAHDSLSQYDEAITVYEQALPIFRAAGDRDGEANDIQSIGGAFEGLGQYQKAAKYFEQALSIYKTANDSLGQGYDLMNLGKANYHLSRFETALRCYEQAAPLLIAAKNQSAVAGVLMDSGNVYDALGQYSRGIQCFERALPMFRAAKNRDGEARDLNDLGATHRDMGEYQKAIDYYEQALVILREIKNRSDEERDLSNVGRTYLSLQQYDRAIYYLNDSLRIAREVKDRYGEANDLTNLGTTYASKCDYGQAIRFYEQAVPIFRTTKDRIAEAENLDNLMLSWNSRDRAHRKPSLAAFYGKQAVNIIQSIRLDINGMDKATQKHFVSQQEGTYRELAGLLISLGRLTEAIQTIDLLKQEEYLNFNKPPVGMPAEKRNFLRDTNEMTPHEARWDKALTALGDTVAEDIARVEELEDQKVPTAAQKEQLNEVARKFTADNTVYRQALADVTADFTTKQDTGKDRLAQTVNADKLETALRTLGRGNAALYTLVRERKLHLLLVTGRKIIARSAPLSKNDDLDAQITAFRALLQRPDLDPRPAGKKLYDLLIAPIKSDLDRARVKTLLVSLDGNLRYIPLAALSPDGKRYLIEQYRTVLYTPASIETLLRNPKPQWTALAMGVAKPPSGFAALPAVPAELQAVVRTRGESGPLAGAYPGARLLDASFTRDAMVAGLAHGYPLVHIASHFVFTGDETTSFLLLGDGSRLTLSDLKAMPAGLFSGVNLLTLSACETATGNMGATDTPEPWNSSRDVENVAVLAQRKGADAVLASLWSVNDDSTSLFMRTFYRSRIGSEKDKGVLISKVESLRRAQLSLLMGKDINGGRPSAHRAAILENPPAWTPPAKGTASALVAAARPFPPGLPTFAHPYYWAPFILIGNGK